MRPAGLALVRDAPVEEGRADGHLRNESVIAEIALRANVAKCLIRWLPDLDSNQGHTD